MKRPQHHYSVRTPSRPPPFITLGVGLCRLWLAASIGFLLFLAGNVRLAVLNAQEDEETAISREHRIKAAYLYQFGRYVEWPAKAFPDPKAPFVIGVLESDPIGADLIQLARIKKIQDRPIQIRRFSSAADIRACHILFLPASLAPEAQKDVLRRLSGTNTLTVGESDEFLNMGGAVRFVVEENNIRVQIARKAAEREGLTISSKLLQVARVLD